MPYVVLALLVVPAIEIFVLVQIGQQIGALPTVLLLIADSFLGAWLVRREGTRVWSAFSAAMGSARIPAREVADGALVIFGGALLLTPGFLTDVVGILCLLPPTRAVLRKALMKHIARRAVGGRTGWLPPMRVRSQRVGSDGVIEGELYGRGDADPPAK